MKTTIYDLKDQWWTAG